MENMEVQPSVQPESQPQVAPEAAPAPTPAPAPEVAPAKEGEASLAAAAAAAQAYQPNFKFKANNKEYEIDEKLRGLIKDKETEELLKNHLTKAYAFDGLRGENSKYKTEYENYKKEVSPIVDVFNQFQAFYNQKDWDNMFNLLGIPDDLLYRIVNHKLSIKELTPEQQAAYNKSIEDRRLAFNATKQYESTQSQYQTLAVQNRNLELQVEMMKPDVSEFAKSFNDRLGSAEAFKQEVIRAGKEAFRDTGKDISAEEAIRAVMDKYKVFFNEQPVSPQPQAAPIAAQKPPVIPNVAGRTTAPVKQTIKSLDDIRNKYKSMTSQA